MGNPPFQNGYEAPSREILYLDGAIGDSLNRKWGWDASWAPLSKARPWLMGTGHPSFASWWLDCPAEKWPLVLRVDRRLEDILLWHHVRTGGCTP